MKRHALFIDDERYPKTKTRKWRIIRSADQAMTHIIKYGCPNYISFDNDLQRELEGIDLVRWLIELDLDNDFKIIPQDFEFNVHSANGPAANLIKSKLEQYLYCRKD